MTTEIAVIIDMSGSMCGLTDGTIKAYNSLLGEQQGGTGDRILTTVFFNDAVRIIHDRVPVSAAKPVTGEEYRPDGCTALLDAVGSTVDHIRSVHEGSGKTPEKMFVFIITDGYENSSSVYTHEKVARLIKDRESAGWEFRYLGSEIDAKKEAGRIGISEDHAREFSHDDEGVCCCMRSCFSEFGDDPREAPGKVPGRIRRRQGETKGLSSERP